MGGAAGPTTFRHVVEYCDGWMPIHSRREILPALAELRAVAEEAGRDPASIELGVFGVPPKAETMESYRDGLAQPFRRTRMPWPALPPRAERRSFGFG